MSKKGLISCIRKVLKADINALCLIRGPPVNAPICTKSSIYLLPGEDARRSYSRSTAINRSLSRAAALNAAEGLPPLPESLSGILNLSGGSRRDLQEVHSKRTRIQAEISSRAGGREVLTAKPGGLDAALALLRKEMIRSRAARY
ncbi:leucine repeat adapter protein 25-like [Nothobranchius furzeri]|uniref:leucine repeat adapter protein 25-like n=1 Tax=Nothobranchius furzeri TaxID=105023 RepID=UPI003904D2A0